MSREPRRGRGRGRGLAARCALAVSLAGAAVACSGGGGAGAGGVGAGGPAGVGSAGGGSAVSAGAAGAEDAAWIEQQLGPDGGGADAGELAREVAADWHREAGGDPDAAQILRVLRDDLAAKLKERSGAERLEALRAEAYDRRARALSRRSLALGKAVLDEAIADATARTQGQHLLDEVRALLDLVRGLRDRAAAGAIARDLEEVSAEARFALEGGAMSRRLEDYKASKGGAAGGPPRVE